MKINPMNVLAGIMLVLGAIWALQGAGILPGSFMSGDRAWLLIGIVMIVLAIGIIANSLRNRPKTEE